MNAASLLLATDVAQLDLQRLVKINPDPFGARWISTEGSYRRGWRGKCLGTIEIRHARGYGVLLQLDDGRIEVFPPGVLRPDLECDTAGGREPAALVAEAG